MDRGAWWATVHRVTKSRTRLSNFTKQLHTYIIQTKFPVCNMYMDSFGLSVFPFSKKQNEFSFSHIFGILFSDSHILSFTLIAVLSTIFVPDVE